MKKVNKSNPPNVLTEYAATYPEHDWDKDFRNHDDGNSYNTIRQTMLEDQGGLCGYCEKAINTLPKHYQRVEHYHNKSDTTDAKVNWALDWNNVFAVCTGGSQRTDDEKTQYPLPKNLSCDAHKGHLVNKKKLPEACEGYFLNPLRIITTQGLFGLDKATGKLTVNQTACQGLADIDNSYDTLETLVTKTIEILNLNCDRLCADRLKILKSYNQEVAKARKVNDRQALQKLARRWFHKKWPSFFTTRRILLGKHAEAYLVEIAYNG